MDLNEACSLIQENSTSTIPLPDAFIEFLEENGLDSSIYAGVDKIPRYIRFKPGYECQLTEIEAELDCKLEEVDWLPGFFFIPSHIQIARTSAYRTGKIYGMDAASGAAVLALNVTCGDDILDLCAAPGGTDDKDVEDIFREWTSRRTWKDRKNAAKRKSATSAHTSLEPSEPELIFYGRDSGIVGMHRNKLFHIVDATESSTSGYDKVLVDAECTHDGSIKHIQKFQYWGWSTFQRRVLDAKRTQNLTCLQLALLTNGFRLLKVGGFLVYSTCSLTVSQNEAVVERFLSRNPSAELMKVDSAEMWCCRSGGIPQTLRFDPKTSQTSGLFIAKFTKRSS